MEINLLVFGQLAEITGKTELKISDVKNTVELNQKLIELYSKLAAFNFRFAVNKKMVTGNTILCDKDMVALLPPFSGG